MSLVQDIRDLVEEVRREESVVARAQEFHNAVARLETLALKAAAMIEKLEPKHA